MQRDHLTVDGKDTLDVPVLVCRADNAWGDKAVDDTEPCLDAQVTEPEAKKDNTLDGHALVCGRR